MNSAAARFVLLCAMILVAHSARAQWNVTRPSLIDMRGVEMAGLAHNGGHTWAGTFKLFESLDSGATWKENTAFPLQDSDYIRDISMFDTDHIMVTGSFGIYTSTNGGTTWRILLKMDDIQQATAGTFCGSPDTLAVIDFPGTAWQTTNAGATWKQTSLNSVAQKIFYHNGVLYAMTGIGNPGGYPPDVPFTGGVVFKSTDGGTSWQALSGVLDEDSYDMAYYECGQALMATNEAWNNGLDSASQVLISTDDGASWQVSTMARPEVIGGGLTTSKFCAFATTTTKGIQRLMGTQWQSIGGPNSIRDTRSVCAIDDNILIVIDQDGNIVRTMNSGGFPVSGFYESPKLLTASLFNGATINPCQQLTGSVLVSPYAGIACRPPFIKAQYVVGSESGIFSIDHASDASLSVLDSDVVTLHPFPFAHDYQDTLVIELSDGNIWRVPLIAKSVDSSASSYLHLQDVSTDTIGDLSIPITGRVSHPLEAHVAFDTSMLMLKSVTDANGRTLSTQLFSGRMVIAFADSAGFKNDTLLATLNFDCYPKMSESCARVTIDSVRFVDTAFCAALSGVSATVCFTGTCGNSLITHLMRYGPNLKFQIVPNPVNNEAVLKGSVSDDISISLFDAAGVLRKTVTGPKIDLSDLREGVYLARVQSGEYQAAIRLVHIAN